MQSNYIVPCKPESIVHALVPSEGVAPDVRPLSCPSRSFDPHAVPYRPAFASILRRSPLSHIPLPPSPGSRPVVHTLETVPQIIQRRCPASLPQHSAASLARLLPSPVFLWAIDIRVPPSVAPLQSVSTTLGVFGRSRSFLHLHPERHPTLLAPIQPIGSVS
ncbi:hypothetical protein B0H34DRAFT_490020 [Crassisporium funariophilum]|nr:hypothetical protein B0H34DRAFT_490020 [Crassisporium funariophilum]